MPRPPIDQQTDALLLIDLQWDFLPGGPLAVPDGDAILPGIEALAGRFHHVLLTQDWHPRNHISFAATHGRQPLEEIDAPYGRQVLWPEHCVQETPGAGLAVAIPHAELILRKGVRCAVDGYSAFLDNDRQTPTGLAGYLRERGLKRLFFAGLAYDFCVRHSALDSRALGFEAHVLHDLTRAVGLPGTVAATDAALDGAGVPLITASQLLNPTST